MRKLLLLRGAMGAGKSTFIREKGLEAYTISTDAIRLMLKAPTLSQDGTLEISQEYNRKTWKLLYEMVEDRMKVGDFIVVDATHIKAKDIKQYEKLVSEYRYRTYVIDFSSVPKDVAIKQNNGRQDYKVVREDIIEKAYENLDIEELPRFVEVVPYYEADRVINITTLDFSNYKKIHHIGDIHGCYTALMEFFKDGLREDELYIFLGDFVDRGIENAKVLEFFIKIKDCPNVILLEGNHEAHLWNWSNEIKAKSKVFETETRIELEQGSISKKEVRMLYRKLRNLAYYTYGDKKVLVTHSGLPTLPNNLNLISSQEIIRGVGGYGLDIDECFANNVKDNNIIQIHGHRNSLNKPIYASNNSFNLEGKVEFGGKLRILTLSMDESSNVLFTPTEIENKVFKLPDHEEMERDTRTFLECLRNDEDIQEKQFENISSFNFKRDVFYKSGWTLKNVKARGVFINTETSEIVGRGYEKFFNIGEREETQLESLKNSMKFPSIAYVKENGYLGIVGIDTKTFEFVFASKSSIVSSHAEWLKNQFFEIFKDENDIRELKLYMIENNVSLVFEVIEPINSPHVIEYEDSKLVLLDVIKRTPTFEKLSYQELVKVGKKFGFEIKKIGAIFKCWDDFIKWYYGVNKEDFKFNKKYIEGFVIEDKEGFMVKIKIHYYNYWKQLRTLKDRVSKGRDINLDSITDQTAKDFILFVMSLPKEEQNLDIITLRNMYYKATKEGIT